MGITKRLQAAWFPPPDAANKNAWLSRAFSLDAKIYAALVALRRMAYARGWLKSARLPVPVIVVGNVIAGGAGKTPIVIELARFFAQQGISVGVISRGYGRRSKNVLEVLESTPISESGDEPALIKRAVTAPVFVANKRFEAGLALLAAHPQVKLIVCDDGMQHLALQRDLEIIVFDERGVGNGRLLPAGPLREPWPRSADFVLHRGAAPGLENLLVQNGQTYEVKRRLADFALRADGSRCALAELKAPIFALAAIAEPQAFFNMLRERGLLLDRTQAFPDHYDFQSCSRTSLEVFSVICTEKDAVKLWKLPQLQGLNIYAVPLITELPSAFYQALMQRVSLLLKS